MHRLCADYFGSKMGIEPRTQRQFLNAETLKKQFDGKSNHTI